MRSAALQRFFLSVPQLSRLAVASDRSCLLDNDNGIVVDAAQPDACCCRQAAVYHRDLKLENALIHISPGAAPYLKICDFGFSKVCLPCSTAMPAVQSLWHSNRFQHLRCKTLRMHDAPGPVQCDACSQRNPD